jgi:NIMA (never in mitosis gene a)-related kinase
MHRDLKSANIFLSRDMEAKIGDMNVSKIVDKDGLNRTQTGTPYYASPEVWRDEPYNFKSDIWSLGCVIYEMAALKPPFDATDMQSLFKKVNKGIYCKIGSNYSQELALVIS